MNKFASGDIVTTDAFEQRDYDLILLNNGLKYEFFEINHNYEYSNAYNWTHEYFLLVTNIFQGEL